VKRLAEDAYEHRHLAEGTLGPARLSVLADALEEAGCTNADLLTHLRGPGPHVRGCWVVDLILGEPAAWGRSEPAGRSARNFPSG
jgi:hypothetical protein